MFTKSIRLLATAGLFALAPVASSLSAAKADWTITGSCVGGWGLRNCVVSQRDGARDPHVRPVHGFDTAEEAQNSIARDRKWVAFCKPVKVMDRFGVERYHYAKPGCEFGRAE